MHSENFITPNCRAACTFRKRVAFMGLARVHAYIHRYVQMHLSLHAHVLIYMRAYNSNCSYYNGNMRIVRGRSDSRGVFRRKHIHHRNSWPNASPVFRTEAADYSLRHAALHLMLLSCILNVCFRSENCTLCR